MQPAGDYPMFMTWYKWTAGPSVEGQVTYTYTDMGGLWCNLTGVSSLTTQEDGRDVPGQAGTINVRQYVALSPRDHLTSPDDSKQWEILNLYRGDGETICDVESPIRTV